MSCPVPPGRAALDTGRGVYIPRCAPLAWDMSSKTDNRSMTLALLLAWEVTEAGTEGDGSDKACPLIFSLGW